MECIGCKYFYYDSGGGGQCDHFLKELCFKTDKMFYVLPIHEGDCGFTSKEAAENYFLSSNLENTPPPWLYSKEN